MWTRDNRPWFINLTAVLVGAIQYYWVFFSCLILLLLVAVIGILIYSCCKGDSVNLFQQAGDQNERQPLLPHEREAMSEKLMRMSRSFNFSQHTEHKECCICMVDFESSDMVTQLPCDKRHYFHSACIERWSMTHNDCPLCKAPFDAESLA